jgi:hypothetical protein
VSACACVRVHALLHADVRTHVCVYLHACVHARAGLTYVESQGQVRMELYE